MINSTILGLSTVFLASSPFSIAPYKGTYSISIENSLFYKSLHTLFYFNINSGTSKFTRTIFDHIINRAICVDSTYDVREEIIEERYAPSLSSHTYKFVSCMFRKCKGNSDGGAVFLTVPSDQYFDVNVSFEFCSFILCYTTNSQGGAIYCNRIGDVSLSETCFSNCFAGYKSGRGIGQAVYISHNAKTCKSKCRFLSLYKCPNMGSSHFESVFYQNYGMFEIENSNFTENHVDLNSSALCLSETSLSIILYTSCVNCTGSNTIYFVSQNTFNCKVSTLNIINCSCQEVTGKLNAIFAIIYSQIEIEDSVFIMYDNKNLVKRKETDLKSSITFKRCTFSSKMSDIVDSEICEFVDCEFAPSDLKTKIISYFDSQQCWEIPSTQTNTATVTKTAKPSLTTSPFTKSPQPTENDDGSGNSHDNYKSFLYISIANLILLVAVMIFLIVKCIFDHRKKDQYSSYALTESLDKYK